jgi:hypothetical protein
MPTTQDIIALKESVEQRYLGLPGVTAIDVGYKYVGERRTDQVAIRVHVAKKSDRVPKAQLVPTEIDGVVTDVLERTYELQVASEQVTATPLGIDSGHYSPLVGGISIGPSRAVGGFIFAGTLGAIVTDSGTSARGALTNFHVACVDSGWHVGDRQVQPSRIEGGVVPTDEFGQILRATLSSDVDGALVQLDSGRTSQGSVVDIGPVKGSAAAVLGSAVRKRGRTTGLTHGSVDGLAASVTLDYGDGIGSRTLTNQITIAADTSQNPLFSDHGDSGSVVVDASGYVVGLLFAGGGTTTFANPIASVLSELNVALVVDPVKSVLKDVKDGRKDLVKETIKENIKDRIKDIKEKDRKEIKDKDKELVKDRIKDTKEIEKVRKDVGKDVVKDASKDIVEGIPKAIADNLKRKAIVERIDPGNPAGPVEGLDERLAAIEGTLSQLASFIASDLRPDLTQSAFAGEDDLTDDEVAALRAELEGQAAQAAAVKAEFDNLPR